MYPATRGMSTSRGDVEKKGNSRTRASYPNINSTGHQCHNVALDLHFFGWLLLDGMIDLSIDMQKKTMINIGTL